MAGAFCFVSFHVWGEGHGLSDFNVPMMWDVKRGADALIEFGRNFNRVSIVEQV
jgi:hypothetical protein